MASDTGYFPTWQAKPQAQGRERTKGPDGPLKKSTRCFLHCLAFGIGAGFVKGDLIFKYRDEFRLVHGAQIAVAPTPVDHINMGIRG